MKQSWKICKHGRIKTQINEGKLIGCFLQTGPLIGCREQFYAHFMPKCKIKESQTPSLPCHVQMKTFLDQHWKY